MAHNIYHQSTQQVLDAEQVTTSNFEISSFKINQNDMSASATSRQLTISGDKGSKFNIQVFNSSNAFYDFTQRPTDYGELLPSGGVGDWTGGVPSTTEPQFGYTQPATGGTSWAPWTSDQYANRFQGMNIGQFEWSPEERAIQVGGGAVPTHGQQEALDFLGAMEPEEAEQIISSAAMAGINPIASRYAGPQLSKAFSAFEQQSPDIGGGEMFRRYVASEPWKTGRWIPTASTWDLY